MLHIKPFWIHNTSIGYKKIYIFVFIILFSVFFSQKTQSSYGNAVVLAGIFCLLSLLILAFKKGVVILQHEMLDESQEYLQVKDIHFPLNPSQSMRVIYLPKQSIYYSALFISNTQRWPILDVIRKMVQKNKLQGKTALILGGGGGTVPIGLLEHFNFSVTAVEISKEIVMLAHQYFLPLREKILGKKISKIQFIHANAFKFMKSDKKNYELIVVDIFNGANFHPQAGRTQFMKTIARKSKHVIVNFGPLFLTKNAYIFIRKYAKTFKYSQVYLHKKNLIGIFSQRRIKSLLNEPRVF